MTDNNVFIIDRRYNSMEKHNEVAMVAKNDIDLMYKLSSMQIEEPEMFAEAYEVEPNGS